MLTCVRDGPATVVKPYPLEEPCASGCGICVNRPAANVTVTTTPVSAVGAEGNVAPPTCIRYGEDGTTPPVPDNCSSTCNASAAIASSPSFTLSVPTGNGNPNSGV